MPTSEGPPRPGAEGLWGGMPPWMYALGCVLAPLGWAVLMYAAFSAYERRQAPAAPPPRDSLPPPDYSI